MINRPMWIYPHFFLSVRGFALKCNSVRVGWVGTDLAQVLLMDWRQSNEYVGLYLWGHIVM